MLTCRLGHIGIEAMLYWRALRGQNRRYAGVTVQGSACFAVLQTTSGK